MPTWKTRLGSGAAVWTRNWAGLRAAGRPRSASSQEGTPFYKFEELYVKNHQNLPRLPIPNLDHTLDRYLRSLRSVEPRCPDEACPEAALNSEILVAEASLAEFFLCVTSSSVVSGAFCPRRRSRSTRWLSTTSGWARARSCRSSL